jgi:hypothetical protein
MPQSLQRSDDLRAYLQAHQHAFAWAEKAVIFRSAAKTAQATAAVDQARQWLRIIRELEPQGKQQCISLTLTRTRRVTSKSVSDSIDKAFGRPSRQPVRKRLSLLGEGQ